MVNVNGENENSYSKRLKRARELFKSENFEEASILFHQLIDDAKKEQIEELDLWVELGWSYFHLKRFESTIICLQQILKNQADYDKISQVYHLIGLSHVHLGRQKKAINAFELGLHNVDPGDSQKRYILFDIGQVHFQRGEYPICKKYFEEARTLFEYESDNEDLAKLYYSLGFTYYYLQDYSESYIIFEDMEKVADIENTKALSLYGQAFIMINFGNYEKLIELVSGITEYNPDFEDKETLAYFMCVSYKALQNRVKFDLFFSQLKKKYPEGKFSGFYEELGNW